MYPTSIRWVDQWYPSVHWVNQWHSSVHWTSQCTLAQGKGNLFMHRGRDKIPPVHKRYCPLSCMIIVAFRFEFGRNMFPRVQYNNEPALVQIWLTAKQATAHTMIIHRPQHGYTQVENSGVISRLQLRSFRTIALCLNIACIRTFNVWETKTHKSTSKTHPTHWVSESTNSVPATILPWCYFFFLLMSNISSCPICMAIYQRWIGLVVAKQLKQT